MSIDPRTPVLVGVGQAAERLGEPGYRGLSPVELAAAAARAALADTGADAAAVTDAVDTVVATRQFENSIPNAPAPLGRSNNFPRSVAQRIGAAPARAVLDKVGGQGPQQLLTEFAHAIAAGTAETVLLCGAEAISTIRHLAGGDGPKPDFAETVDGSLEDRGFGLEDFIDLYLVSHGLTGAPVQYGLMENARRARLGVGPAAYLQAMGELFAPMTAVAAANPYSAAPITRTVDELVTVSADNRMICDPYPRLLVARDQVNQGAAALLMSVAAARRLGVPEQRWVYLHGHADVREQKLLDRADLGASPAAVLAVTEALAMAGVEMAGLAGLDLYSCFPVPVFNICDAFLLTGADPRGLTLTGGLPYFGGAGNNYSMHAIAEAAALARRRPGTFTLVGANGGMMSKYSVGVYSTTPTPWRAGRSAALQAQVDALPTVPVTERAEGPAKIETYSVHYDWPTRTGVVIGRLDADGSRFLATSEDDDLVALLADGEPLGAAITVRALDYGNRCSLA